MRTLYKKNSVHILYVKYDKKKDYLEGYRIFIFGPMDNGQEKNW